MYRRLAILCTIAALVACGAAAWAGAQPSVAPFLVPVATDVHVAELGWGQRLITYQVPDPAYGWYSKITRDLKARGWTPPTRDYYRWGSTEGFVNLYTRRTYLWVVSIQEQAELQGTPRFARIILRRSIAIHWPRFLG